MNLPKGARIGLMIGLVGGLIGLVVGVVVPIVATGGRMSAMTIGMPLIFLVIFGLVGRFIWKTVVAPMRKRDRLIETGVEAEGTIVAMQETSMRINDMPVVELTIEVELPNGGRATATTRERMGLTDVFRYQPGARLRLKIDPNDPTSVAIVDAIAPSPAAAGSAFGAMNGIASAPGATQATSSADAERIINEAEELRKRLAVSGTIADGTIRRSWPLGVNVNGANPLMGFLVDVTPSGDAPFMAEVHGVVSQASLGKTVTGRPVQVRYDPADNRKVVLEKLEG